MRVAIKKKIASLLVFIMILTSFVPVYAAPSRNKSKNDITGHWAETDLLAMASNGVMGGYPDGSMKPDRYVTIAETVKIINKAFNIVGAGDVYSIPYTDVKPYEWYSADIALAVENGYLLSIAPGKRLRPNAPATREQIGAMFAQVMGLESKTLDSVSKFSDYSKITQGYNYYFAAAVKEGLFAGYPDNTLRPQTTVTRGIMAAVSNRAMSKSQTTELHKIFVGPNDILIETDGTAISNRIVDNVWIAASVGEGTVTLDNVKVRGKLVIQGGGPNSVIVKGESDIPLVYMEKETRDLRLKVEKPAIVGTVNVNAGSKNYITGEIESLIPNVKRGEVRVDKAKIKTIEVKGEDSDLYVDKDSEVNTITVNRSAANAFMSLDGKITSVVISAPLTKAQVYGKINNIYLTSTARASEIIAEKKSHITTVKTDADRVSIRGDGQVDHAIINGNDCKVDTVPTKIDVDKGASGTTSGGKPIPGGSSGTTKPGGGVDGGAIGPNDPNAKVTTMEVTKYPPTEKLVYTVGDTLNLDGLEVTFKYSNGATASVPLKDFAANSISIDPNPDGKTKVLASTKAIKITHVPTNKSATLNITVNPIPKVKEMMVMVSPKVKYIDGDLLDLSGMEVLLRYDNETTKTIKFEKTKVKVDGVEKDSDSFKDIGIETSMLNGTPLTLKRPGNVQESKTITVSFRNPGNQIVRTQEPLFITIDPIPRIVGLSAAGYKFSYMYGDKFDFTNLEVKLVSSDTDARQIELRYIPALKDFVIKKPNTSDAEYTSADLYKTIAANGDILREVKITQEISKKDVLVSHGDDVGLGDTSNIKKLKIAHLAKDVEPASTIVNIEIKPPSKAVSATIAGMAAQFDENTAAADSLNTWDITVTRDSIVSQKPGEGTSEMTKVLYGTSTTTSGAKLYEYTTRTDQSTWKPYNYSQGDSFRNMSIIVMKRDASGMVIPGPDISLGGYNWSRNDVAIRVIHSESGVRLDTNGNPVPTNYNNVQILEIPIFVKPEKGIERLEILLDPTLEGNPPKTKIFYVGETLQTKLNGMRILVKEYGADARYFEYKSGAWVEQDSNQVDLSPQPAGKPNIQLSAILKSGAELPVSSTLDATFDGAKIKIKIIDAALQEHVVVSKELQVRTKIESILVRGIYPIAGQLPKYTLDISENEYASSGTITWTDGVFDSNGNFIAGQTYAARVDISPKSGYVFAPGIIDAGKVKARYGITAEIERSEIELKTDGKLSARFVFTNVPAAPAGASVPVPAPIAPTTKTLASTSSFSYVEPTSYTDVSTATEFYNALNNVNVKAIRIVKNMTLNSNVVVTKPVTIADGVVVNYVSDPISSGRNSNLSDKHFKTVKQFRITGKGVIYIKSGAVLNNAGKGEYKVDNGGRIIVSGTLSKSGTKLIGKEGTRIKTYGKSVVVITGSMAGPVMTLEGNADLLQSMTLDHNLVVSPTATLNVKKGKTLTANNNITITNNGNIYVEEDGMVSGTGKYKGESPTGNYFTGFIIEGNESVRYGSRKTSLDQKQLGSDIRLSLSVPKEAKTIYLKDVFINAGDLRQGSYVLVGNSGLTSAIIEISAPSKSTGLSSVTFGYKSRGITIPNSPGKYTLTGIIGGANVTLDIYVD